MKIGKLHIGYRTHDSHRWKKYLLPKAYNSDRYYKHDYFKFYYRWLNFYWCMPRKCECCGKYMPSIGGIHIWNYEGTQIITTICRNCVDTKKYTDKDGRVHEGYNAWIRETWDNERERKGD